jgi:hypothetical protein
MLNISAFPSEMGLKASRHRDGRRTLHRVEPLRMRDRSSVPAAEGRHLGGEATRVSPLFERNAVRVTAAQVM